MMQPVPVILVVEDEPATREMLQELLEEEGYAVETAVAGAAGLARLEAGGIDLVLLDLQLPDMHGLELCRQVRARQGAVSPPIIMLTSLESEQERHAGFAAGADDYVVKPFRIVDLLDRVQVWLGTRQELQTAHLREQAAFREVEARTAAARLEGITLTARELADRIINELAPCVGVLELVQARVDLPADLQGLVQQAALGLEAAVRDIRQLERVVRVEIRDTPVGPALDLDRSVAPQ